MEKITHDPRDGANPPRGKHETKTRRRDMAQKAKRGVSLAVSSVVLLGTMGTLALPAHAAQINELEMKWGSTAPTKFQNGGSGAVDVWINSNDANGAAGSQQNTTITLDATNGVFKSLPALCLVDAATPVSSISADGKQITCNVGTVKFGTAKHVEFPMRAEGNNGDKVSILGSFKGAPDVNLAPRTISAAAGIEVIANGNINQSQNPLIGQVKTAHGMALAIPVGGEFLKGAVEVTFRVTDQFGLSATDNLDAVSATHSTGLTAIGGGSSTIPSMKQGTANLKKVGPGLFKLVINDYATTFQGLPTKAADGSVLPEDLAYIAAFNLNFVTKGAFDNHQKYAYDIVVEDVKAESLSGTSLTSDTNLENNTSNAVLVSNGRWAGSWSRDEGYSEKWDNALGGQGTAWDANAQMLPGEIGETQSGASQWNNVDRNDIPADARGGLCVIVDNRFVEYQGEQLISRGEVVPDKNVEYEYLVSAPGNLVTDAACDAGTWTKTKPADLSKIAGVRASYNAKAIIPVDPARPASTSESLRAGWKVKQNVPHGQAMWSIQSADFAGKGEWVYARSGETPNHAVTQPDPHGFTGTFDGADVVYAINTRATSSTETSTKEALLGEPVDVTVGGALNAGNGTLVGDGKIRVQTVLPATVKYIDGSAVQKPKSVVVNADGTTTITWENATEFNKANSYKITVEMISGAKIPKIVSTTTNISQSAGGTDFDSATSSTTIRVTSDGETFIDKKAFSKEFAVDSPNKWTITLQNKDAGDQEVTDIIDVLPYNGDGRGTKMHGTTVVGNVTSTHQGVVYYSAADPKSINADPAHATNGEFGKPSARWSTTKPAQVTAVRVVGKDLGFGEKQTVVIPYTPKGGQEGDRLSNIAQGRATSTVLKMIKADTTTVLPSALQIDKKFVEPVGETNTNLVPGSSITYDLTVKNSGPGAASRVTVTDHGGKNILPGSVRPVDLAAGDSFDEKTSVWTLGGTLASGKIRTLRVVATISPEANGTVIENSASVQNPTNPPKDTCIPNVSVASDTDQCDVEVITINNLLKIDKALVTEAKDVVPGATIEYALTGMNAGETVANGVLIKDIPVQGLVPESISITDPSHGEIVDGMWQVGNVQPGEKVTAKVTGKLAENLDIRTGFKNATSIENPWHPVGPIEETVPNDTVELDTDQRDIVDFSIDHKLQIAKKLNAEINKVIPGSELEYTVTVQNEGPDVAHHVVVNDLPLDGLDVESLTLVDPSLGTITEDGQWVIDELLPKHSKNAEDAKNAAVADGTEKSEVAEKPEDSDAKAEDGAVAEPTGSHIATVTVKVKVAQDAKASEGVVNMAVVEDPWNPVDPNTECVANNEDVNLDDDQCDVNAVEVSDKLQIDKSPVEGQEWNIGDTAEYLITVKNASEHTAENVVVTDAPVSDLKDVELVDPSKGTINKDNTREWNIGSLAAGETVTVSAKGIITGEITETGKIENKASVQNPWNPLDPETCEANENVDADTDQCDSVVVDRDPVTPPVIDSGLGAGKSTGFWAVVVGLGTAMAGLLGAFMVNRRRQGSIEG